jgi:hypothetical protein
MNCEDVTMRTMDYVEGALEEEARLELEGHLEGCPSCRSEQGQLKGLWEGLGHWSDEPSAPALRDQVLATLRRGDPPRRGRTLLQAAAGLTLLVAGLLIGSHRSSPARVQPLDADEFLLVLWETPQQHRPAQEERQEVEKYKAWARKLEATGRLVGGEKLEEEARLLRQGAGSAAVVTRGTALEPLGMIAGYFVIRAHTYDEAIALTRDCPHLAGGGTIELRKIDRV